MRANKNTRAVIVGLFIAIAIAIFVVAVLALGSQKKTFAHTISIDAIFNDVNGLQAGSNIWYAGVKVGTVHKIQFTPDGKVDVQMHIEDKSTQYIHADSRAKIGTDGLIGNKIIVIYGGTAQRPQVREGDRLLVENQTGIDEMMNTFQENNKNLLDITGNFKTLSKQLVAGKGTAGKLLMDDALANQLQTTVDMLRKTSSNAQSFTTDLADYTSKLQRRGSLTNDIVTDTVIFSRLRSTSRQLDELSQSAGQIINNLTATTHSLNNSMNDTTNMVGVLLHDPESASQVKTTLHNLQTSTKKLDENMEALQHNFLLRGFFRKKQKREEQARKDSLNKIKVK